MVKNFACSCHKDEPEWKPRYTVNVLDRIKALMGEEFLEIPETSTLVYTFDGGYEKLERHAFGHGTSTYSGTYHPDGGNCVVNTPDGVGVCEYCGTVWH